MLFCHGTIYFGINIKLVGFLGVRDCDCITQGNIGCTYVGAKTPRESPSPVR